MPRASRIVLPGTPHHVTQRGNRRQPVLFDDGDYWRYRRLLAEECQTAHVQVWAYCLMPNHVHLLLVPSTIDGMTRALSGTHRRYTSQINQRQGWTGHLWQGRYGSTPLGDDGALLSVVGYIERNPVEAGLVERPEDWIWSSARGHLGGCSDTLLTDAPLRAMVPDWAEFLGVGT